MVCRPPGSSDYPMDCSLPGSSVHGIFQAKILEYIAILFSRGSSQPRDWTQVCWTEGRLFTSWATRVSSNMQGTSAVMEAELLGRAQVEWICIINTYTDSWITCLVSFGKEQSKIFSWWKHNLQKIWLEINQLLSISNLNRTRKRKIPVNYRLVDSILKSRDNTLPTKVHVVLKLWFLQ